MSSLVLLSSQVQTLPVQIVIRLPNVHPVSWQTQLVNLSFLCHRGEDFSFDWCWSRLYPVNDWHVEQVQPCINLVTYEDRRFFNKPLNPSCLVWNNDSISGRVLHVSDHYGPLLPMSLMEFYELFQRILAYDIRIKNEEQAGRVVFLDMFCCKSKRTSCSQRFSFNRVGNLDSKLNKIN